MNILLQSAGVAIMIVIFIFYFIDRKSAVRSNKLFLYQAIAILLSAIIDIFSIVCINKPDVFPMLFTKIICKAYLATVVLVVCLGLVYVLGDIRKLHKKLYRILCLIGFSVFTIAAILVFALPINVVYDPVGLNDYTEGLPIIMTYVCTFIIMGITIYVVLKYKNEIYEKRVLGVIIFISVWIFGSAIQGLVNYVLADLGIIILSVSLSEALGSLVIYIMLENPSLNVDKVTGALNSRAFLEYVDEVLDKGAKEEFLLVNYDNEMSKYILDYNSFTKKFVKSIALFNVGKIFKNDRNDFMVTLKNHDEKDINERVALFKEQFYSKNSITTDIPVRILHFKNLSYYADTNDFIEVIKFLNSNETSIEKHIVEVTEEMVSEVHKKFIMKKKCDRALASNRVVVYFQPIYSNVASKFTTAEALVRLIDENGNLIYPNDFILDMERDGKIIELGRIVFENVCQFISENDLDELGIQYIEVNLSTIQCMQTGFAESFIDIAKKYKIDPKYINFEITETGQTVKNVLLKNMNKLKNYGFAFSLDDFGTGNSNLNYIVDMPVEIVKFDKTMVNSYFNNELASYVMNSTINMIKGLGYRIVFEGIETYEQTVAVKKINVEYIQGYYYSKPIKQEEFIEFIKKNNSN